jgi:hypothetical protein
MTSYALQKLIREVNRNPATRADFFKAPDEVAAKYDLSEIEKDALVRKDYHALYGLGVHGLLLRPFSILHSLSEKDYLDAIRGKN